LNGYDVGGGGSVVLGYDLALSTNRDGTEWDESDETGMHDRCRRNTGLQ